MVMVCFKERRNNTKALFSEGAKYILAAYNPNLLSNCLSIMSPSVYNPVARFCPWWVALGGHAQQSIPPPHPDPALLMLRSCHPPLVYVPVHITLTLFKKTLDRTANPSDEHDCFWHALLPLPPGIAQQVYQLIMCWYSSPLPPHISMDCTVYDVPTNKQWSTQHGPALKSWLTLGSKNGLTWLKVSNLDTIYVSLLYLD